MALVDRMIRASRGELALYEEVEHDPAATSEALTVVVVVGLAGGIGTAGAQMMAGGVSAALVGLVIGVVGALVGWAVFAGVTYFIGTRLFNGEATWEEVLRILGYAYSPGVVNIIAFVPLLGPILALVAALWSLYLAFVAIRAALDISSGQTIATILLSLIPAGVIIGLLQVPLLLAQLGQLMSAT